MRERPQYRNISAETMPTYLVDFDTERGPRRERFTIDADRPLGVQVRRILDDMRLRGVVLRGSHEDELEIAWNGVAVDVRLTPEQLQIETTRPLQLRMRRREALVMDVRAALRVGQPRRPFVPLLVAQWAWSGVVGAMLAWVLMTSLHQTEGWISDIRVLDAVSGALLAASTVLSMRLTGQTLMSVSRWWLVLVVPIVGAVAWFASSKLYVAFPGHFTAQRAALFGLVAGVSAFSIFLQHEPHRWGGALVSLLAALILGAIASLPSFLPGPSDVWLLLSWLSVGAAAGSGAAVAMLWGAGAVVEDLLDQPSLVQFLRSRTAIVREGMASSIADELGAEDASATLTDRNGVQLISRGEAVAAERAGAVAMHRAVNGEVVWIGPVRVRVRLLPEFWQ